MRKHTGLYIAMGLSAALLAGCQEEDIIQPIDVETTVAETTVEETTTEAATEESKAIPDEFIYIFSPEEYNIYTDGKPHQELYYSDETRTLFMEFTSVSKPELGIASVSFPSCFVEQDPSELNRIVNGAVTVETVEDGRKIYDYADMNWMVPNSYARWVPSSGRAGIISVKSDFDPVSGEPSVEDFEPAIYGYKIAPYDDVDTKIDVVTTREGVELYSMPIATYVKDINGLVEYYGFVAYRYHNGMMQGVYCTVLDTYEESQLLEDYILQSLVFTD